MEWAGRSAWHRESGRGPGALTRRLRAARNPLRRRSDRIEAVLSAVLLLAFFVGAPLLTTWAAGQAYRGGRHAEVTEAASRHLVSGWLLESTPVAQGESATSPRYLARARFVAPDGTSQEARVPVAGDARVGSLVDVWVDDAGRVVGPPANRLQTVSLTVLAGAGALAAATLGLLLLRLGVRVSLDRIRLRAWEREWRAVEPRWRDAGRSS